jgi:hypothetical protein
LSWRVSLRSFAGPAGGCVHAHPNIKPAVSMVMSFLLSLPRANFIERGYASTCAGRACRPRASPDRLVRPSTPSALPSPLGTIRFLCLSYSASSESKAPFALALAQIAQALEQTVPSGLRHVEV